MDDDQDIHYQNDQSDAAMEEPEVEYDAEYDPNDPQARLAYLRSIVPPSKPKKKWPGFVIFVIVVLLLITAGVYFIPHLKFPKKASAKVVVATSQTKKPKTEPVSSSTTQYTSNGNDLNLSFTYPKNWTVTPPSGDNPNAQPITVSSPVSSIKSSTGTNELGKVAVMIRSGSTTMAELSSGNATVGQTSVQFSYSQPTSGQQTTPFLTFINLTGGANSNNLFQEVLISGSTQFAAGQSITAASIAVDPIVTASFYACTADDCSNPTALNINYQTWADTPVFQQTLTLFESLQFN
jgi:hypothetical protein